MPPSRKLCTRERVRPSPYARNDEGSEPLRNISGSIQRHSQNKQLNKLLSKAQRASFLHYPDEVASSDSSDESHSEGSVGLPDTEADYYFPALDRYNERLGTAYTGFRVGEDKLLECSGCASSQWCDGDTYFTQPAVVENKSGARGAQAQAQDIYCQVCMQKRVGPHGDRDEAEPTCNDECMQSK